MKKILFIYSNFVSKVIIKNGLEKYGFTVSITANLNPSKRAINQADLVIVEFSNFVDDIAQKIITKRFVGCSNFPIIFCVDRFDYPLVAQLKKAGVVHFQMPLDIAELVEKIEEMI